MRGVYAAFPLSHFFFLSKMATGIILEYQVEIQVLTFSKIKTGLLKIQLTCLAASGEKVMSSKNRTASAGTSLSRNLAQVSYACM